jgi:nicotinamide-nucleotide amidase
VVTPEGRKFRVEVLAIGDELLDGRVADTNTLRLAQALAPLGLEIVQRTTVRDDIEVIIREARAIMQRGTKLCVVSGGLGPTADDVTSEAFAKLAGCALVRDEEQQKRIEQRLIQRGRPITDNQLKQADRPMLARVIANDRGTAPGFSLELSGCRFVSVPGVPAEFDGMIQSAIIAPLAGERPPIVKRQLKSFGLIEAEVDKRIAGIEQKFPNVRVGFRVKFPEIHVTLNAEGQHAAAIAEAEAFVKEQLGEHIFTEGDAELAAVVLEKLKARGENLATAESCTGGLVADLITDIAGASEVFVGGVCTYAYATKTDLLGVSNETLKREGAVSEAAVREMARGARQRFGARWAVSASGVAGPGGGTPEKPVGTIWIGLAGPDRELTKKLSLPFDRRGNKLVAAYSVLDLLRRQL